MGRRKLSIEPVCKHTHFTWGERLTLQYHATGTNKYQKITSPARWGGDEFIALLSVSSPKSLEAVKSRLQGTIDDFNRKQSRVWKLNISMGHVLFEKSSKDTLEGLISFADAEMYESRRAKRLE